MLTRLSGAIVMAAGVTLAAGTAFADFPQSHEAVNGKRAKIERKPDWEKLEEPALRPYKAVFRGLRSLVYHTVKGLADGNEKFPVLGSVEAFRGLRTGSVELVSSTYTGMAGSLQADYRMTGRANEVIESDIFLRNAADALTAGYVMGAAAGSAESGATGGASIWAGQKFTDRSPVDPKRKERADERKSRRKEAQERYLGRRAAANEKSDYTGNIIRKVRD